MWYMDNILRYLDGLDPTAPSVLVPHSNLLAPGKSDTYQCEHGCSSKVRSATRSFCGVLTPLAAYESVDTHQGKHGCGNMLRTDSVVSRCVLLSKALWQVGSDTHPCNKWLTHKCKHSCGNTCVSSLHCFAVLCHALCHLGRVTLISASVLVAGSLHRLAASCKHDCSDMARPGAS